MKHPSGSRSEGRRRVVALAGIVSAGLVGVGCVAQPSALSNSASVTVSGHRIDVSVLAFASIDLLLGVLFLAAYLRTGQERSV